MSNSKYRCGDCFKKYKHEPIRREQYEKNMSCKVIEKEPRHFYKPNKNNIGNPKINFKHCIGNYFNQYYSFWINYHANFEKGMLPFKGTYLEQPSKFVDLMNLVDNLMKEDQEIKAERAKKNGR